MVEPRKIKRYGWRPQLPDPRDLTFGLREEIYEAKELPAKFSLRDQFPFDVFDQLQIGTCVPNHAVENLTFRAAKEGRQFPMLSRLFVYYEGRKLEGAPLNQDTGMEVRTAFKVLGHEGAPPEVDWPYSDAQPGPFDQQPTQQAYADAAKFEALQYKAVVIGMPGAPLRSAVFQGMPVSFGFPVPAQFEDPSWSPATQPLVFPGSGTQWTNDGHCENVVGWDFSMERFQVPVFEIRNSYGKDWGDAGHHWMDYRWFDRAGRLASDLWVVSRTS